MNAKKIAYDYLDTYEEQYVDKIDPMMVPFKKLLTENGYITLHSCSGHVRVRTQITHNNTFGLINGRRHTDNRWYLMFVDTKGIETIEKILYQIQEKHNYRIKLEKIDHPEVIDAYVLEYCMNKKFNNAQLYEINKNIYNEFKKEFEK